MSSFQMNNKPLKTATVFDWDDTLCPTTFLFSQNQLSTTDFLTQQPRPDAIIPHELATLDLKICELLVEARSIGPVFITCSHSTGWMEKIVAKLFPRLLNFLNSPFGSGVVVMSAPTSLRTVHEHVMWKLSALESICKEYLYAPCTHYQLQNAVAGRFALVCVGNSTINSTACHGLLRTAPHVVLKTLAFSPEPTTHQVFQQIQTLIAASNQVVHSSHNLNLSLPNLHLEQRHSQSALAC